MAKRKKTRQSNREYRERLRREDYGTQQENLGQNFRVLPSQNQPQRQEKQRRQESGDSRQRKKSAQGRTSQKAKKRSAATAGRQTPSKTARSASMAAAERSKTTAKAPKREREAASTSSRRAAVPRVYFDYTLVFIVVFLVLFGLLMIFTASIYDSSYFAKQFFIALLGMAVMLFFSFFNYHIFQNKTMMLLIVVVALITVFMVRIPAFSVSLNGASRWVKIGPLSFQPAEVFKIAVILLNACLITHFSKIMAKPQVLLLFGVMALVEAMLILFVTSNLSSALIIGAITVFMVFVAYPGYKLFVGGTVLAGGAAAGIVYYILNHCDPMQNHMITRIFIWLAPERLPDQSKVYQTTQALYSIGSGGFWGKGLGTGTQKLMLPEAMNDMIFAIICEELGVVGAFLVLVMFAILLYRLLFIAKNSKDLFGGMIVTGIFSHFMLQVVLNVGVVTNVLPPTGVTLPFISCGGTALVLLMAEVGIALNVSRQIDFEQPKLVRRKKKR